MHKNNERHWTNATRVNQTDTARGTGQTQQEAERTARSRVSLTTCVVTLSNAVTFGSDAASRRGVWVCGAYMCLWRKLVWNVRFNRIQITCAIKASTHVQLALYGLSNHFKRCK